MARPKGMGLMKGKPFTLRLDANEKRELKRKSKEAELSMVEYARCKIFDRPMKQSGGKNPRGRPSAAMKKAQENQAV